MKTEPVQYFHDLLSSMSSDELEEMRENFLRELTQNKARYGTRLLTKYLRPKFLTKGQMTTLREVCTVLRNAVIKVKDAYFEDPKIVEDIALTDPERKLTEIDPGFARICINSRWDSFWGSEGLKFVELNAESPAGVAYTDIISNIYLQMPVMKSFMQKFRVEPFHVREILLDALLMTYQYWHGNKSVRMVPNIAIVDWSDVPTFTEFELLQDYFEFHGIPTVIADPRELDYRNGRLRKGDFEIDLIYRRVLIKEFLEKLDEVRPMLKAYEDRNVCIVNSFRTNMLHKKSLFAILSDSQYAKYFSDTEKTIIERHIPWTRVLRDVKTEYHGGTIDLLDFVSQNRDSLVIKPNDEYGGEGVVIGWEISPEKWQEAIRQAANGVYVVQEKVPLAKEIFPYYDGGLKFDELLVDLDPYLFGVNTAGVLVRLSVSSLANVTAGGGATVAFVIDEKG